ncbi:MAG: OsmC family peroxiredoxin [Candidatus Lokiarchaeota archaeon]|nr:OsmC family peroxiredoxin [Candidatus Lokiarchaeota archaeon]
MSEEEFKTSIRASMDKNNPGKIVIIETGIKNLPKIYVDDEHEEPDKMLGPDPSRLLTSAIVGCLSASYVYCMQKKNLNFDRYEVEADYIGERNEEGLWRVKEINIKLKPDSDDENIKKRIKQCSKIFERTCTVTESVRAGIKVNVDIDI